MFNSKINTLFVFNGESNSGGIALNSQALSAEIGLRPSVKILNNVTLSSFDTLNIGVNNLIGHDGLEAYSGLCHGFELELANRAESSDPYYMNPCYLIKTGQGGSQIAQWNNDTNLFYTRFLARVTQGKIRMPNPNYRTVVLYSIGINDAIYGTTTAAFKTGVSAHFVRMRSILGADTPIIMTQFQSMLSYGTFDTAIAELADEIDNVYCVSSSGAGMRDANHWSYAGMKTVTGLMLDIVENL